MQSEKILREATGDGNRVQIIEEGDEAVSRLEDAIEEYVNEEIDVGLVTRAELVLEVDDAESGSETDDESEFESQCDPPQTNTFYHRVLAELEGTSATSKELHEEHGEKSASSYSSALSEMFQRGMVERIKRTDDSGVYQYEYALSDGGRKWLKEK